jgi:hypothetical protein
VSCSNRRIFELYPLILAGPTFHHTHNLHAHNLTPRKLHQTHEGFLQPLAERNGKGRQMKLELSLPYRWRRLAEKVWQPQVSAVSTSQLFIPRIRKMAVSFIVYYRSSRAGECEWPLGIEFAR